MPLFQESSAHCGEKNKEGRQEVATLCSASLVLASLSEVVKTKVPPPLFEVLLYSTGWSHPHELPTSAS